MDIAMAPETALGLDVLRACLADEMDASADWPTVPESLQGAVVSFAQAQRVTWTFARATKNLGFGEPAASQLRSAAMADALASLRVQSSAVALVGGLNDAGIRCITYKGVALALATTGDPSARGAGDLDVLVHPDDVPAAHGYLLSHEAQLVHGYCPAPTADLWPLARWSGCEMPYRWRGVDIDLHWRFDRLPQVAAIPFDDLWASRSTITIAERSLPTLGTEDALLVTVAHGTKEHWRHLRWVVDLVRQSRDVRDWEALRRRARATGCERALLVGLAMAERLVPGLTPCPADERSRRLASAAWGNLIANSAPFGRVQAGHQVTRLAWAWRTAPSIRTRGSMVARQLVTPPDMVEIPLPVAFSWLYPALRPAIWVRRLRTGRFGAAAPTNAR